MRILFSVKNPEYVRHYAPVLRALTAHGHQVELVKQSERHPWPPFVLTLAEKAGIQLSTLPDVGGNPWWELATRFRQARLYLWFLEPSDLSTLGLLERARKRAPAAAVWLGESFRVGAAGRRILRRLIDVLERATRSAALFHGYLRSQRPDVVVLTPLIVLKTTQLDLARAANELGIRNVFAVASWDHLSSKGGVLSFAPQRVFVWNDVQKREAAELHGIPADRVVVTGSQVFDEWFERRPSTSREAFCARVGLRHDRPLLLYVCSSLLENSPPEAPFVLRWARELRQSGHPVLQDCSILVRPHPRRGREWRHAHFADLANIRCWPPQAELPTDLQSQADYFDSLYHADAIVGLNTSAMIEAAILGRPVLTILVPEFRDSQEGTIHFHYLLSGPDSPLSSTRSLAEHTGELASVLGRADRDRSRSRRFVRAFVRPHGLEVPATSMFVDAVEALGAEVRPVAQRVPLWTHFVRPFIWPFALAAARRARRVRDEHRRQKAQALLEHRRRKAGRAVDNMTAL